MMSEGPPRLTIERGQVWRFTERDGRVREMVIEGTGRSAFGHRRVRGRTRDGAVIACSPERLVGELAGELVSAAPPDFPPPRSRR